MDISTPIITYNRGWTTIGQLHESDVLFDVKGNPNPISKLEVPRLIEDALSVQFNTGEKFSCHPEVEWLTNTSKEVSDNLRRDPAWRKKRRLNRPSRAVENPKRPNQSLAAKASNASREHSYLPKIDPSFRTTLFISNTLFVRGDRKNHVVEVAPSINTSNEPLCMDPYTLGMYLGDGAAISTMIIMEADDWANIEHLIPYSLAKEYVSGKKNNLLTRRYTKLRADLNKVLDSTYYITPSGRKYRKFVKRIPNEIYMASYDDRLNCLKGLMDTDGTVDKDRGRCEIGFSDFNLASDTHKLLSTLGIKCSIRKKKIKGAKTHYRMQFNPGFFVFNLDRKRNYQVLKTKAEYVNRRYIEKINFVGECTIRNLMVTNTEVGFLIGNALIPTR